MVEPQEPMDAGDPVTEIINRLRVLESKQSLFNERLLLVNQNMIEEYKKFMRDIKTVREDMEALKKDLQNVKNIMKHLSEEAANFAKKDNLKVLEKYINLWNPIEFVTREEVVKMIGEKPKPRIIKKEGVKLARPK